MPFIRTDDGPRRLRAVWLGPKGFRWYWTWSYVQWFVTFFAIVGCSVLFASVIWAASGDLKVAVIIGPMWGGALGYFSVREAMTHVDYDRPLRYWRATIRGEWRDSSRVPRARSGPKGWWLAPDQPRMMSRHALAYLGLSTTRRPIKLTRPAAVFNGPVALTPAHAFRPVWTIDVDSLPRRWRGSLAGIGAQEELS